MFKRIEIESDILLQIRRQSFRGVDSQVFSCKEIIAKRLLGRRHQKSVNFRAGEAADRFAVVLGGAINVIRYEEDGRETIVEQATRGELIGAAYVAAGLPAYLQNAIAADDSFALVLNGRSLMDVTRGGALERVRLRLLGMMARKNLMLQRKLVCLSQKKTADKLLTFLRMTQQTAGTESFEIPYTREQLAAYLNVARPTLSAEISRLV